MRQTPSCRSLLPFVVALCVLVARSVSAQITLYGNHATVAGQGFVTGLIVFANGPGGGPDGVAGIASAGETYFEMDFGPEGALYGMEVTGERFNRIPLGGGLPTVIGVISLPDNRKLRWLAHDQATGDFFGLDDGSVLPQRLYRVGRLTATTTHLLDTLRAYRCIENGGAGQVYAVDDARSLWRLDTTDDSLSVRIGAVGATGQPFRALDFAVDGVMRGVAQPTGTDYRLYELSLTTGASIELGQIRYPPPQSAPLNAVRGIASTEAAPPMIPAMNKWAVAALVMLLTIAAERLLRGPPQAVEIAARS